MELKEITLASTEVYAGKVFTVEHRTVTFPTGGLAERDVVMTHHATAVVPVTEEGEVILVRQFRAASQKVMLELPAGKMEPGEEPAACAARELEEETGYAARVLRPLIGLWVSPAIVCEKIHIFLADGLVEGQVHRDADEFMEVERLPLAEACRRILTGEIDDGKTVAGLLLAREVLNQRV